MIHGLRGKAGLLALLLAVAVRAETVQIGAQDDGFPYAGRIGHGVQGISPDIVRAAFERQGLDVELLPMPYARCLAQTRLGQLVACFSTQRKPSLEADFLWHEPPMFKVQPRIYALADSTQSGLRPRDLEGKRVAVTHAYEYGPEFDDNPRIRRVVSLRDESGFRMLLRGRADYVLAIEVNTRMLEARHPELAGRFKVVGTVPEADVYTVFSRRHPQGERLMRLFEKGLREMQADGQLRAIEAAWLEGLVRP